MRMSELRLSFEQVCILRPYRQLDRDMTIRGYCLPKGTPIIFAPITLHRSPDNWLRPDEFLPERFMPQQLEEKVDPSEAHSLHSGLLGLWLHATPAADCPAVLPWVCCMLISLRRICFPAFLLPCLPHISHGFG